MRKETKTQGIEVRSALAFLCLGLEDTELILRFWIRKNSMSCPKMKQNTSHKKLRKYIMMAQKTLLKNFISHNYSLNQRKKSEYRLKWLLTSLNQSVSMNALNIN